MRGLVIHTASREGLDFMASDLEYRQETRRQEAPFPSSQVMLQASGDELEHQNLSMLLKVFPGISLHSIAEAYTMAEGDPNYAAELLSFMCQSSTEAHPVHDQEVGGKNSDFFEPKPLETVFHFERSAEQLEEGEKQDAASVLCAGTPSVHNHSGRPPETKSWEAPEPASPGSSSLGIITTLMGNNGANVMNKSPTRGNGGVTAAAAGNRARDGTGNGLPSNGNSLLPGWKGFSNGNKLSAVSGTVSCHRQRRNEYLSNDGGKDSRDCREGDEAFFYGKQRKKKGGVSNSQSNGNATDALKEQKAAEDFLHSMLGEGFELGIDVVGDVLDHFGGDINKAMETLLHMASTSAGFHNTELSDQVSEPLQCLIQIFPNKDPAEVLIAFQGCDENVEQATNALLPKDLVLRENSGSDVVAEQSSLDRIVAKLHENFPTVELSFLSEVLQASECSYGDAVQALKEAGMIPLNEKAAPKVDPVEVLHALFKTDSGDAVEAGPSTEKTNTAELYTVVAARARKRNAASGNVAVPVEIDEYEKHRGSANDHWSTMKKYFQEAAAAHGRGERALAGVLSQKGQLFKGLAREASLRASENIFNVKNRDIENNITIDLHAQHVQEALRLLKLHLRSLSSISSVHTLTVITGHGQHSASGRAKIKPALTQYLAKMQIPWLEPNAGCLIVKMQDVRSLYSAGHKSSDSSSDNEA